MRDFTYDVFYNDCDVILGFNAQLFSKEQALETAMVEFNVDNPNDLVIEEAYVWKSHGKISYHISNEFRCSTIKAWSVTLK